ncbi:MAG: hypothetical protein GF309_10005 [Candidatus Lokiarchaeota archaeon]|nr:hypothetical protein [Candidatus Lokiarchaeota archaeon]
MRRDIQFCVLLAVLVFIVIGIFPIETNCNYQSTRMEMIAGKKEMILSEEKSLQTEIAPIWNHTYGGDEGDNVYSVIEVSSGGYAFVGNTYSYGAGLWDMWLGRVASNGTLLWNRTFGGIEDDRGYDLLELSDGFIIVGNNATDYGDQYVWVVRTDLDGHELWNKTYARGFGRTIYQHDSGEFTVIGEAYSGIGRVLYLLRIDSLGEHIWSTKYERLGADITVESAVETDDGGFAIVGQKMHEMSETSAFIAKFDEYWRLQWEHYYGGLGSDDGQSVCTTNDGDYVLIGRTRSLSDDTSDVLVVRIDENGNHLWTRNYDVGDLDAGESVTPISSADCVILGSTDGNMWFARLDEDGSLSYNQIYGGPGGESGSDIQIIGGDGFLLSGRTTSYGPGSSAVWMLRLPVLEWIETPPDMEVEYLDSLRYDLKANSSAGIISWSLNDTTHFDVNSTGTVKNASVLSVGTYHVSVWGNDSVGGILAGEFTVVVQDTKGPTWIQEPTDQVLEAGDEFQYDLNATDESGIYEWKLNVTTAFSIGPSGVITTNLQMPVDDYPISVSVSDIYGNWLHDDFILTIQDTKSPEWVMPPENQIIQLGEELDYKLYASDLSGIFGWTVNDTDRFAITSEGHLRNITPLSPGTYSLNLSVCDTYDNQL